MIPPTSFLFPFAHLTCGGFDLRAKTEGRPPIAPLGNGGGAKGAGDNRGEEGRGLVGSIEADGKREEGSSQRGRE